MLRRLIAPIAPAKAVWLGLTAVCVILVGVAAAFFVTRNSPPAPRSLPVVAPSVTPKATATVSPGPVTALPRSVPVSISIPAIGVKTTVMQLGLVSDSHGNKVLAAPPLTGPQANDAGWWAGGFTPGQAGNSVLVGHVNSAAAGDLVFGRLSTLKAGDTASVTLADNAVVSFRVTAKQETSKAFSNPFWTPFWRSVTLADSPAPATPGLVLITCGGAFDSTPGTAEYGHYTDNVLVYLTRVTA